MFLFEIIQHPFQRLEPQLLSQVTPRIFRFAIELLLGRWKHHVLLSVRAVTHFLVMNERICSPGYFAVLYLLQTAYIQLGLLSTTSLWLFLDAPTPDTGNHFLIWCITKGKLLKYVRYWNVGILHCGMISTKFLKFEWGANGVLLWEAQYIFMQNKIFFVPRCSKSGAKNVNLTKEIWFGAKFRWHASLHEYRTFI